MTRGSGSIGVPGSCWIAKRTHASNRAPEARGRRRMSQGSGCASGARRTGQPRPGAPAARTRTGVVAVLFLLFLLRLVISQALLVLFKRFRVLPLSAQSGASETFAHGFVEADPVQFRHRRRSLRLSFRRDRTPAAHRRGAFVLL
ncbi:hypothetical protein ACV229_24560 [Burkholderia sp. MR1-5-21]